MTPAPVSSATDKAVDRIVGAALVKYRTPARFLVGAHLAMLVGASLLALVLVWLTLSSTSQSGWLTRILAEVAAAVSLLLAVPMVRMRAISRAARSAVPGRPSPTAAVIRLLGDYWLAVALVIGVVAGLDFIFTGITWIMTLLGRFRA